MDSMSSNQGAIRNVLLDAASWFFRSVVQIPGVQRVALIGSIITDKPSPKDVDFLVYVTDDTDLAPLAALARKLQGRLQSHNRGADVFLADDRGRYLGRTCSWRVCAPGVRASCDALHCGRRAYLHDDVATVRVPTELLASPPLELWPVIVRRCSVPMDVERFLSR